MCFKEEIAGQTSSGFRPGEMPVSEVRVKSRFGLTRDGIYRKSILVTCTSSYYIIMTINATCLNMFIWASHTLIPLELTWATLSKLF